MVAGSEILAVAAREIGVKEFPPGSNHVKYNTWYYGRDVSGSQYPWCMAFVQWVYDQAGAPLPFKTPSCGGLLRWYQRNQPECIVQDPIEGCIVIFDWPNTEYNTDHTGLFVRTDGRKITTIDGNTSNSNDSNGGMVQQRTRNINYANPIYIRPRGLVLVDWDKAIDEMTDEQAYKLYSKAERHMATLPLPTSWDAKSELDKAIAAGITDGTRPMVPAKRYETATMVERGERK